MILNKVIVREEFSKESQFFILTIELEDEGIGIHRCKIDLRKGMDDGDLVIELKYLAYQVKDNNKEK